MKSDNSVGREGEAAVCAGCHISIAPYEKRVIVNGQVVHASLGCREKAIANATKKPPSSLPKSSGTIRAIAD